MWHCQRSPTVPDRPEAPSREITYYRWLVDLVVLSKYADTRYEVEKADSGGCGGGTAAGLIEVHASRLRLASPAIRQPPGSAAVRWLRRGVEQSGRAKGSDRPEQQALHE